LIGLIVVGLSIHAGYIAGSLTHRSHAGAALLALTAVMVIGLVALVPQPRRLDRCRGRPRRGPVLDWARDDRRSRLGDRGRLALPDRRRGRAATVGIAKRSPTLWGKVAPDPHRRSS